MAIAAVPVFVARGLRRAGPFVCWDMGVRTGFFLYVVVVFAG